MQEADLTQPAARTTARTETPSSKNSASTINKAGQGSDTELGVAAPTATPSVVTESEAPLYDSPGRGPREEDEWTADPDFEHYRMRLDEIHDLRAGSQESPLACETDLAAIERQQEDLRRRLRELEQERKELGDRRAFTKSSWNSLRLSAESATRSSQGRTL